MPIITKIEEEMSLITCDILVYRNIIIKDAAVTIKGNIVPPHPGEKVIVKMMDEEGNIRTVESVTDTNGEYRLDYKFDKCGKWKIWVSWNGDMDHYSSVSEKVTALVFEL